MAFLGVVIAGLTAACLSFHALPAKIERKVQPLYTALETRSPNDTTLMLALDGAQFDMVRGLREQGHFPSFQAPSRMISTFPSTTIIGFTGLFRSVGCEPSEGYETKFFSVPENRLRGYTLRDYHRILIPFKQYFNYYRLALYNKFTMYAFPYSTVRRDIERIHKEIMRAPERSIKVAYIGGTDGASHILGERPVRGLLIEVSRAVERWRQEYRATHRGNLQVVLFSDHGFHFESLRHITLSDVKAQLKGHAYRLAKHLERSGDIVPVTFGSLSSAVFYTFPDEAEGIAQVLSRVKGFDLLFYRKSPHEIGVYSHSGTWAIIEEGQNGQAFRYRPVTGDPLGYSPRISRLFATPRSYLQASPWLSQDKWWQLTKDHPYPDAFARLYDAFGPLVKNQAQILASTLPGYEYGSWQSRIGARLHGGLKGTHGGLFDSASSAVVMTTLSDPAFPPIVSYRDVLPRLQEQAASAPP